MEVDSICRHMAACLVVGANALHLGAVQTSADARCDLGLHEGCKTMLGLGAGLAGMAGHHESMPETVVPCWEVAAVSIHQVRAVLGQRSQL